MAQPNFYAQPNAPLGDPAAQGPLTCPWCMVPATPGAEVQRCTACAKQFTLTAGPALDASLAFASETRPAQPNLRVKWSAIVTYRFAELEPAGVASGHLDPVIGIAPLDRIGIAYGDVVSLAVWRKIRWIAVIAGFLIPLPIFLFLTTFTMSAFNEGSGAAWVLLVTMLGFGAATAYLLYSGLIVGDRQLRVVGRWRSFTVPFGSKQAFHTLLFARCGLKAPPIP